MSKIYWEYAGTQYRNKFHAYEAAGRYANKITAHFYDSTFNSFDFSTEPSQTHQELLTERAFQIRDKYKYIKFCFSGGADSTTVLNTFLKNNIFIDEIIVFRFSMIDDFTCISNCEVNNFAIPFLKTLNLPKTKINIIDYGSDYFNELFSGDKFFRSKNTSDLREFSYPKINGKNFCYLKGDIEPVIKYIDGSWWLVYYDSSNWAEQRLRNVECFFSSPDLPELVAKESHMLKKVYKKHNMTGHEFNTKDIFNKFLRDKPIAPRPDFFAKENINIRDIYRKTTAMLKSASPEMRQNYYNILASKIDGQRVIDIFGSHLIDKYYIGE